MRGCDPCPRFLSLHVPDPLTHFPRPALTRRAAMSQWSGVGEDGEGVDEVSGKSELVRETGAVVAWVVRSSSAHSQSSVRHVMSHITRSLGRGVQFKGRMRDRRQNVTQCRP